MVANTACVGKLGRASQKQGVEEFSKRFRKIVEIK